MKRGYLSQYFESVAAKKLTAVEVDPEASNGHELNSIKELKQLFGEQDLREVPAVFLWLGQENESLSNKGKVSWYDSRRNQPNRSAEWRLYYDDKQIIQELAQTNDTIFIAKRTGGLIMLIVTSGGSTIESQLFWLFGLKEPDQLHFELSDIEHGSDSKIDFVSRFILDELGIEVDDQESDKLDQLLEKFKGELPSTKEFSEYARKIATNVSPLDDPDAALMAWLDMEEKLFRRMEHHLVSSRLREGFVKGENTDVDGFISFSLQVQNRRKSRAGLSLENHLEALFKGFKLRFERGPVTENKCKPDFLFPSAKDYHNPKFPSEALTMLGSKTTCKDRWRQISSEAKRIDSKHLLTLEPGITLNQTDEMRAAKVQLVLPTPIHASYIDKQRAWLMNLSQFIAIVQKRQMLRSS